MTSGDFFFMSAVFAFLALVCQCQFFAGIAVAYGIVAADLYSGRPFHSQPRSTEGE